MYNLSRSDVVQAFNKTLAEADLQEKVEEFVDVEQYLEEYPNNADIDLSDETVWRVVNMAAASSALMKYAQVKKYAKDNGIATDSMTELDELIKSNERKGSTGAFARVVTIIDKIADTVMAHRRCHCT